MGQENCIEFAGALDTNGYGMMKVNKKMISGRCTIKTLYIPGVIEAMEKANFTNEAILAVAEVLYKAHGKPGVEKLVFPELQEVA